MESKFIWVFIKKNDSNKVVHLKTYGSITKMVEDETIKFGNEEKGIWAVRNLLKSGKYEDDKYLIQKTVIERSSHKN